MSPAGAPATASSRTPTARPSSCATDSRGTWRSTRRARERRPAPLARVVGALDGVRRDGVRHGAAAGVADVIFCRCGAHLVESDDDQTPDETCCVCRGKSLQAARRRRFRELYAPRAFMCGSRRKYSVDPQNRHAEKPNAPDCSEACDLRTGSGLTMTEAKRGCKPEKPSAPDLSEARLLTRVCEDVESKRGRPHASDSAESWQGQAPASVPEAAP